MALRTDGQVIMIGLTAWTFGGGLQRRFLKNPWLVVDWVAGP
jgi:putative AlgH/UPF0301 family transcriptional regulator